MFFDKQDQAPRLLAVIQRLLAIEETEQKAALEQAALLIAQAIAAEKADVFLYEQESQSLVAQGVSATPLGQRQKAIGMNRLPLVNKGQTVKVFQTGKIYRHGQIDQDPEELPGVKEGLGIRSVLSVPLLIAGELQGVVQVDSTRPDAFSEQDERFLEGVAHWMEMVIHRANLLQRVSRAAAEQARRGTAQELMTVLAHDLRTAARTIGLIETASQQGTARSGSDGSCQYEQLAASPGSDDQRSA